MTRLGILAGGGDLPLQLIRACAASKRPVFVIAFEGDTSLQTVDKVAHEWVKLNQVGRILKLLHKHECRDLVLIGNVTRPNFRGYIPDLGGLRFLPRIMAAARQGDDALLRVVNDILEKEGFVIRGVDELIDDLTLPAGTAGKVAPNQDERDDIEKGFSVVRSLGAFEIGQAAVVRDGQVLAVEAAEGTDAMLERCSRFRAELPAGVMIKGPKVGQDRRVDLPTIGPKTIDIAFAAGLRGLAVAAGTTLVVNRERVVRTADAHGMFIEAIDVEDTP